MSSTTGYTPILDNGHGGLINGVYQTLGKRSPDGMGEAVLYEGMFNRWVVNGLMQELDRMGVPYFHASPELEDVPLDERIRRINRFHGMGKCFLLSIHANAGGGEGMEIYTSRGRTAADGIATRIMDGLVGELPDMPIRGDWSDGDIDKESDFYLLRKSSCPAVLLEVAFMDHPDDYKRLFNREFLDGVIYGLADAVNMLYREG